MTDIRANVAKVLEQWGCAAVESGQVAQEVLEVIESNSEPRVIAELPPDMALVNISDTALAAAERALDGAITGCASLTSCVHAVLGALK